MIMEKWAITYTWHTHDEKWNTATEIIEAENIGLALKEIDDALADKMERKNWSDYWVTSISIVPELH